MTGDPLKHVQPGDALEFSATTFNTMVDVARQWQQRTERFRPPQSEIRQAEIVRIKNTSGADVGQYMPLGIAGVAFDPADADALVTFKGPAVVFEGDSVQDAGAVSPYRGRFAITLEPIANGVVGRAVIAGVVQTQVEVTADGIKYADAQPGSDLLGTSPIGSAQILWREPGASGTKWAVVRLGANAVGAVATEEKWYSLNEELECFGSASAITCNNIDYEQDIPGSTGATVTVYDVSGQTWGLEDEYVRARLIQTDSRTDPILAVTHGGAQSHWGKLDGTLSAGSSVNCTLWRAASRWGGGEPADASITVTVHDWLLGTGETLANGTKVKFEKFPSECRWYVTAAEC